MFAFNNMYICNMEVMMDAIDRERKTEKFQMLMDKTTLGAVDDWGFAHRVRTRAEAIRRLIRLGISASQAETKKGDVSA